ncbi:MAG: NAD-dependent epimerase/dehydratase family protein [Saprospiraceae bacterium]|nr:NAD-dependent epimerase/dehydratase family protein [Saprospiraceae bacterium]
MKKILITGASGFIGSTLVDSALMHGWDVTAAIRPTSDRTFLKDSRIKFLELNFKNVDEMRQKLVKAGRF